MDEVFQNHMPVWFTEVGYVAIEDGLLAPQETQLGMRRALCEARLPIIFAVAPVLSEACQIAGSRALTTRTLLQQLQRMENVSSLSSESRLVLLEYLLPDIPLTDFGALEIFPFRDGKFHSLKVQPVFLDRDDFEKTLFAKQRESCIDAARLSETASAMMHERVRQDNHMVRYRNPDDLRDYYLKYIAHGSGDTIELDEDGMTTLSQVWRWILQHSTDRLPLLAIGSLWLVPLQGSKIRKLVPSDISNFVTWFRPGEVKDVALKIFASNPVNAPNVLADEALGDEFLRRLLGFLSTEQSLCIKEGNKFGDFLEFLAQGRGVLQTGAEDIKYSTLRVLKQLCWSRTEPSTARECNLLKSLCLFRAVQWPVNATDTSLTRYWTHKSSDFAFIGLKTLIPVPSSPKQVFIDATNEGERAFFERLGLLKCLNDIQILEEIVIPAVRSDSYNRMCPSFRLEVVKLLFQNYYRISPAKRSFFPNLAVVPLERRRDDGSLRFGRPLDVLDPQQQALRDLYFEDEVHLPEPQFYNDFSAVLRECGMVKILNDRVVRDRICSYARKHLDFGSMALRAKHLLQMPYQRNSGHLDLLIQVARDTKWLPAQHPDKSDSLTASSRCLDKSDELLVGYVWHVLPFVVDRTWRSILGWQNQIELDVLMSQLAASINASDIPSVERTLSYIYQQHSTKNFADRLLKLNFVRSSNGDLVDASKVCRRGGERLVPYLHTVEPRFWKDHSQIMKLTSIAETPRLDQLRNVLNSLDSRNPLNEEDLDVAVEVAWIWGAQFPESVHGLRVPDTNRVLVGVGDLVFNDTPWVSAGERASVHPKVSRVSAEQLKIEPLSELVRNGDLGITDPDDDEFYQREEVADGIRDTLDRYTRQSTFHEYLANADDCGSATQVNFLFDGANYGKKHLLTKELQDLQGPSLLIHNNGGEESLTMHIRQLLT
jgi:sacsin